MSLGVLWTELSLNTRGFQSGLSGAQSLAQGWARKVGGDFRNVFFDSLNPRRFLQSTVNAVQQAVMDIGRVTDAASQARGEIEGPPLDEKDEAAVRVLSDKLGLELQTLADLFRDGRAAGEEFRTLLQSLVSESETQKVVGFWTAWKEGLSEATEGFRGFVARLHLGSYFAMFPGAGLAESGRKRIKERESAEERVRELARQQEEERRNFEESEREADREVARIRREERAQLGDYIGRLRGRGGQLMDAAGSMRTPGGRDSLASIGGFTAGAGLATLTTSRQQLRVLEIIASHTEIMKRAAELERVLNESEGF